MDDQLQRLSRGKQSQQSVPDFRSPGPATSSLRDLGADNPECGEVENILADARSLDHEAFQVGQDTSDQPSYVLRAQDGKIRLRFFSCAMQISLLCKDYWVWLFAFRGRLTHKP